jgi:ABC-2 type transport system permease protein
MAAPIYSSGFVLRRAYVPLKGMKIEVSRFLVFTQKELKEQIRTYKGAVVAIILLLFGMTSPLLAKLTPEIFKMADLGVAIKIPDPTYLDAYAQFFKNIGQMVLIILMLIYSGSVVSETTKGTTSIMLTKRLSRSSFVLSKFLSAVIVWTLSYAASAALCIVYTIYLFPSGKPQYLLLSLACMWLFGILTLAIAIFSSAVFKNFALAAVASFCIWGLTLVVSTIPKVKDYAPALIGTANTQLIGGGLSPDKLLFSVLTGLAATALLMTGACLIFHRREL